MRLFMLFAMGIALCACGAEDIDSDEANITDGGYHFIGHHAEKDLTNDPSDGPSKLTIVDHVGTPLTSTSQVNRDDDYQLKAPNSATSLHKFILNLRKMHGKYGKQLQTLGFDTCSDGFVLDTVVTYCTQQVLWQPDKDAGIERGPQVQDVVVPDSVEIELSQPAKWPNGRPVKSCTADEAWHSDDDCAALGGEMQYIQINDLVLAMGFLDLGGFTFLNSPGECPVAGCIGDDCPKTDCTLYTFRDMKLNIDHNDAPLPNTFPWMAPAW